jgi:Flp pilus assembly protein TadG
MSSQGHHPSRAVFGRLVGQSTVEMAAVVAILLPILVGAVDLGRAYFAYDILVHAVNEGVRRGSFDSSTTNVVSAVQTAGATLNLQSSDVTVTCYSAASTITKTCASMVLGDSVRVMANSVFTPMTPLITALLPSGTLTLAAAAQRTFQ